MLKPNHNKLLSEMQSARSFFKKIINTMVGQVRVRHLLALVSVLIIINLLIFLDTFRRALIYSVEFTYGEGGTLYLTQHPDLLYHPVDSAPYIISFYTPLYYLVVAVLTDIFDQVFLAGRLVSVVATLGIVGIIAKTISSLPCRSRLAPVIASVLFFLSPIVARKFAIYGRVDMLGLFFSVVAIYWFLTHSGGTRVAGCIGWCLLAGLTKQSLVAAPIAILLALIWNRNWRDAIMFTVGGAIVTGTIALAFVYLTEGRAIAHLLIYNRAAGFFLEWGAKQYLRTLGIYFPLIVMTVGGVWRFRDNIPPVIGAYALAGTLVASVMLFRRGASLNHTFEALAGTVMIVGVSIAEITPRSNDWIRNTVSSFEPLVAGVLLLVIGQLFLYGFLGAFVATAPSPSPGEIGAAETISDADRPVISSYVGVVVRADVETDMNDPAFAHYLHDRGLWETDGFILRIRQQRYSYFVLGMNVSDPPSQTFWTDAEIKSIRSNYRQVFQQGRYWVYAPKNE